MEMMDTHQRKTLGYDSLLAAKRFCLYVYRDQYDRVRDFCSQEQSHTVLFNVKVDKILLQQEHDEKQIETITVNCIPIEYILKVASIDIVKLVHEKFINEINILLQKWHDFQEPCVETTTELATYGHSNMPRYLLYFAAQNKNVQVLKYFIEQILMKANTNFSIDMPINYKSYTALHIACKAGLNKNVDYLLNNRGARYNCENADRKLPIHCAAEGGDIATFKLIYQKYIEEDKKKYRGTLEKMAEEKKRYSFAVIKQEASEYEEKKLQKQMGKKLGEDSLKLEAKIIGTPLQFAADNCRYECIKHILDLQMYPDATFRDTQCNTALHYLCNTIDHSEERVKCIEKLLHCNALFGVKSAVGNTPLDLITPEAIEKVLDRQIKKLDLRHSASAGVDRKDKYNIIVTNVFGHASNGLRIDNGSADIQNIRALATSEKHEKLSLHPVCNSILSIKWDKMRKYFLMKVAYFIIFTLTLSYYSSLLHDLNYYENIQHNGLNISEQLQNKSILRIEERTGQIKPVYIILLCMVIGYALVGVFSLTVVLRTVWRETRVYLSTVNTRRVHVLVGIYLDKLIWSDWADYISWTLAGVMLYKGVPPMIAVLVAWFSLFMVVSNLPCLLPYKYILFTILRRYVKFMFFTFSLLSGFGMAFYLTFKRCTKSDLPACEDNPFKYISRTGLKMLSMMIGELDFETMPLGFHIPYDHIIFGAFIFVISICLANMLNGLAVNVTETLLIRSEVFKTMALCDRIYEMEILLKTITHFLSYFKCKKIEFLSPLSVTKLKISPSSGKCHLLVYKRGSRALHNRKHMGSVTHQDVEKEILQKRAMTPLWRMDREYVLPRAWVNRCTELLEKLVHEDEQYYTQSCDVDREGDMGRLGCDFILCGDQELRQP